MVVHILTMAILDTWGLIIPPSALVLPDPRAGR